MKSLSSALTAVLALAAPVAGIAQNMYRVLQPNEHPLNTPGIATIEAPPAGCDTNTASNQEPAFQGFPPRPDRNANPKAYSGCAGFLSSQLYSGWYEWFPNGEVRISNFRRQGEIHVHRLAFLQGRHATVTLQIVGPRELRAAVRSTGAMA